MERADSAFGDNDTGVKLTIFYIINSSGSAPGEISIRDKSQSEFKSFGWTENALLVFNSRAFTYKIK